jgi:hypothetical protein
MQLEKLSLFEANETKKVSSYFNNSAFSTLVSVYADVQLAECRSKATNWFENMCI